MSINIEQALKERFSENLPDNYKRRIIFWQDPEGQFSSMVDEIHIEGVKLLKLTGTNNFAAKMLLSETDTVSNYLVYNPISYTDISDNWLLDIELYSEEFRADLLSVRMQELGMQENTQLRRAMKIYTRFFGNKDRITKLTALKSSYTNAGQLHIDVMAILAGTSSNTASGVIRAILMQGLDIEENKAIENIRKFGSEPVLREMIARCTGYICEEEQESLLPFASHILLTALSVTMNPDCLRGFEGLISEPHRQRCFELVSEWLHSDEDDELYDIAREVEKQHNLSDRFDRSDVEELMNSECLPCINECILRHYMSEISDSIIKADDIVKAVEKRRTLKWYKRVQCYYEGLLQAAQMQQFYQTNIGGFHIAEYARLWKEYTENYCRMDYFYRKFHAAFGKSLKESGTVLDDLYKNVADYVEKLYKNWFLSGLGRQWTMLIADELEKSAVLPGITHQKDFYNTYVSPVVSAGSRVYVIISDALRYEVAVELKDRLLRETKGSAGISSMQSCFPSVTEFGMAALLPHNRLEMTNDIKVLCDGESTEGTLNRDKILKNHLAGSVAITYKSLLGMKQAQRREVVNGKSVVYIYHNLIDAVGDKAATEDQVFEACDRAVTELKNLVRLITNDLSGVNIFITADHGFLYSYQPLEESDKAEKSFVSGDIIELDRRYVITGEKCTADHLLKIPLTYLNSSLSGFTPGDNIRIKKQGGGMNYVHGGISPQEIVVPVIEFRNMRSTSKRFVDVRKAEIQFISQSRKISNSIFSLDFYQKASVSGKITPATYEVFMADASGKPVSDTKKIIADKTSQNGSDRVFRIRLTLRSMEFKKTEVYYLTVVDTETKNITEKTEFNIDVAFINDFDF